MNLFFGNSKFKIPKILGIWKYPRTFWFFDFKNPFAKFYKNLSRTCEELAPHFNWVKFSENSNNFHELVCLARSMSYPAQLDRLQYYNYIFRHCKRLILRLILAHSIKSTLTRFKVLKTSNTRLKCVYHKIIYRFCLFVNVHIHGCIARQLATVQQLFAYQN